MGGVGLIFGCDLKQLFLHDALKMDPPSFPLYPASLFMLPLYRLQWYTDLLLCQRRRENRLQPAINHFHYEVQGQHYCRQEARPSACNSLQCVVSPRPLPYATLGTLPKPYKFIKYTYTTAGSNQAIGLVIGL